MFESRECDEITDPFPTLLRHFFFLTCPPCKLLIVVCIWRIFNAIPSNFILYSPISGTLCWLYIPHLADSYLYMHAKRPCGCACKKKTGQNSTVLLCDCRKRHGQNPVASRHIQIFNTLCLPRIHGGALGALTLDTAHGIQIQAGNNGTLITEYCTLSFLWPAWYALIRVAHSLNTAKALAKDLVVNLCNPCAKSVLCRNP